jgi:hypothetical protein
MGWLYMQSLDGHAGPRAYLDAQFTYETEHVRSTVLRSALVRMRTYYAAVEHIRADSAREVFAIVCLVRYNPRDRDGYIFGYKDMDEGVGPCEAECPIAILDLLTETDKEYALAWRARCRHAAEMRARRPRLRNGWTLVFDEPLAFSDGTTHQRLEVAIDPARPRAIRFRPPGGGARYRIANLSRLRFTIEPNC